MKSISPRKPGFTLAEVLVILAILAALSAVLVPTVTNQIGKAGAQQVASDLNSIRTGLETFVADVNRFPSRISHLSTAITTSDYDYTGTDTYPPGLISRWDGPYIDQPMASGDTLVTGAGGVIVDSLIAQTNTTNNVDYLTLKVAGLSQSDFYAVDRIIDGDTATGSGLLQFVAGDTTLYMLLPIN